MIPKIRMSVRDMSDTVTQTSRVIKARKSYVLREGTVLRGGPQPMTFRSITGVPAAKRS